MCIYDKNYHFSYSNNIVVNIYFFYIYAYIIIVTFQAALFLNINSLENLCSNLIEQSVTTRISVEFNLQCLETPI